ncbi:MAG: sulfur carrier protein ThiS [Candidatus Margulisiibacteriota bacterium]
MQIKVNGKDWQCAPGTTVADLLSYYKIPPQVSVVEVNGLIIPRENYSQIWLGEGDVVEVVRFMAGGGIA